MRSSDGRSQFARPLGNDQGGPGRLDERELPVDLPSMSAKSVSAAVRTTRPYRQTKRAESAAETRRRIMHAARECLKQAPLRNLSLDEVARRAGVSRSTLHLIYRSRADFFVAMARDVFEVNGIAEVERAFGLPDGLDAFEQGLRAIMRFYANDFPLHRAFNSLAALDQDAASAFGALKDMRTEHCAMLRDRLRGGGYLPERITDQEAMDIIWVITSFETFSALHLRRSIPAEDVSDLLLAMAERSLAICRRSE